MVPRETLGIAALSVPPQSVFKTVAETHVSARFDTARHIASMEDFPKISVTQVRHYTDARTVVVRSLTFG